MFEYGKMNITTAPTNAAITLDNKTVGKTPLFLDNLTPGLHQIEASADGFQTARWTVELHGNESVALATNLLSIKFAGALNRAKEHLYGSSKDYRAALQDVTEALLVKPSDPEALGLQNDAHYLSYEHDARTALSSGQLTNALTAVDAALGLRPTSPELLT